MLQQPALRILAAAMVCLGLAASCRSAEPAKAYTITVTGIVKPAATGADEAATVTANKVAYRIVKDDKGKIVAKDAAGKKAEIRGTVAEINGVKWITVTWCALVE